jgi:hypothetical protein
MTRDERTLDLHGCRAEEALEKLRAELARAHGERIGVLVVIHGRGWRSGGKAVLPKVVRDYLGELERHPRSGVRRVRFGEQDPIEPNAGCVYVDLFLERSQPVFDPRAPKKQPKEQAKRPKHRPPAPDEIELPPDLEVELERRMREFFGEG